MTCDFQQWSILTSVDSHESVRPPFKTRNSNGVQSVALHSEYQVISKGCDQTALMRRLI